jgi:hypothetical protein
MSLCLTCCCRFLRRSAFAFLSWGGDNREQDLCHGLSYLQKPERLDPNNFSSIDEIGPWKRNLQAPKKDLFPASLFYAFTEELPGLSPLIAG